MPTTAYKSIFPLHNNYYFFRRLAPELESKLQDTRLHSCYSQSKNELILQWKHEGDSEDFFIKALLNPDFSCLSFPAQQFRAKRNSVDLFPEAIGLPFERLELFENERYLLFRMAQDISLLFKMHGNRSNILLFQDQQAAALFKNKLKSDWALQLNELNNPIDRSLDTYLAHQQKVRRLYPGFSKPVEQALETADLKAKSPEEQFSLLQATHQHLLEAKEVYVTEPNESNPPVLSLLPPAEPATTFTSALTALNEFFYRYTKEYTLAREKEQARKRLIRALKSGQNYLYKLKKRQNKLEKGSRNREIADLIMANLHSLKEGKTEAEVFDFYQNKPVTIKLKEHLSPQKNAELFYRKAKNQEVEERFLEDNLATKYKRQQELEEQLETLEQMTDLKAVRQLLRKLPVSEADSEQAELLPYYEFTFEGYRLFLGKNAVKNDALLRYHTHKDDLWLHAKDVAGSHVIIKKKGNQNVPALVKEKAASLAAWHSKRRNDTLCPVSCTPRKYVRKPKGGAPGLVLIEKEEQVLIVPPAPFA